MTSTLHRSLTMALAACAMTLFSAGSAVGAVSYFVTVNTTAVNGTAGQLEFQFNPGNVTSQPATARITNFTSSGGTLTAVLPPIGDVTGTLPGPVTFVNDTALNDYAQGYNYGTSFSFIVTLSGPAIDSPNGIATAGSTFCLQLEDAGGIPILTNQVSGCAGTIDINLNGTTTATAFPSSAAGAPTVVTFALTALDAFEVSYASNLTAGDSYVDLTNSGATVNAAGTLSQNICVNAYTFDPSEELVSCCACQVTPNGLNSLSVKQDLVSNTLTPGVPGSVVIKLIATTVPAGAVCNAALPTFGTLTSGLLAWDTTLTQNTSNGTFESNRVPFSSATLSTTELARITSLCGFIQANGSGFGICRSCRIGALGGAQQ